ncbi:glycosyltransferase [Rhabdothermincola sp.]|uniref:glycosyltransferase n=1 Tax=Rhabdothermincola sp. TaxID=2820405 RepID=UPI002FE2035A
MSPSADEAPDPAAPDQPEQDAAPLPPPVVIVIVAHDPGPWFEDTLRSVAAQQYGNTSVLVIDAGGTADLQPRIAPILPDALLRRIEGNDGFGAACNTVLTAVQGAAFYLFCHDDVRLAPDVVQVLVEEAFRSNAGIVGPKIVDWRAPDRLLQVGMGADRFGYPAPYVDRGELDQAQHDAVRDVFYIPGAATLVRADLFAALGGFDPGISFHGDDLDLCWRAHVVGARVVVAPAARVAHLEALGARRPADDRRRLQMRHRLRAMRVSTTWWTRARTVPRAALLAILEVVYATLIGRFGQARDVLSAWLWNVRRGGEVRSRRKALAAVRRVPDREVSRLQARGSARLAAFLRGQLGSSEDPLTSLAGAGRDLATTMRSSRARTTVLAWVVATLVLVIGSRDLIFGRLSAIGDLPVLGGSAADLVAQWASGYRAVGLGAETVNPTALGLVGLLGFPLLGAMSLLRKLLLLGMIPLGAAGTWRLCKPIGSRRSRVVGLVVYLCIPLAYNSIATGVWGGLVLYGLTPWIVGQLAKAGGLAPFGPLGGRAGPGVRPRPLVQRVVMVGVLTALAGMVFPITVVVVAAVGVALVVGGVLAGQWAGAWRVLVVSVAGAIVAVVLLAPWSVSLLSKGWGEVLATSAVGERPLGLDDLLRFHTGPLGAGVLGYATLVVAALPLLIGRDWRLSWAVRAWAMAAASFSVVWVMSQGWLPADLAPVPLLLAPAAVGLALASALGMAAFEVDLPDYHFGWRQIGSLLAGAALVLATFPVIGGAVGGRWEQPAGDYGRTLGFLDKEGEEVPFRVLWVGEASVLPLAGWELDPSTIDKLAPGTRLAYATSADGTPRVGDRWSTTNGPTPLVGEALATAAAGGTSRLGALLAPMGIRYIVVPQALAPEPYSEPSYDATGVRALFESQLDLSAVTAAGVVVYQNDVWGPTRALLAAGTEIPGDAGAPTDRVLPQVEGAPVALPQRAGVERFEGSIDQPATVYLAEDSSDRWVLDVGGSAADRTTALGWANAFDVDTPGEATLRFDTPAAHRLMLAGQALLWLVAIGYLLRVRVVHDERRPLRETGWESELTA